MADIKALATAFKECDVRILDATRGHSLFQYEQRAALAVTLKIVGDKKVCNDLADELGYKGPPRTAFVRTVLFGDRFESIKPLAIAAASTLDDNKKPVTRAGAAYQKALGLLEDGKPVTLAAILPTAKSAKSRDEETAAFASRLKSLAKEMHERGFALKGVSLDATAKTSALWVSLIVDNGEPKPVEVLTQAKIEAAKPAPKKGKPALDAETLAAMVSASVAQAIAALGVK